MAQRNSRSSRNVGNQKLMKDLTVDDAWRILRNEGGVLTIPALIYRCIFIVIIGGLTARAIAVGSATTWHLLLPMAFEYLTLLFLLPVIPLFIGVKGIGKEAISAFRFIVILLVIGAIVIGVRAWQAKVGFIQQCESDSQSIFQWIVDSQIHWPMIASAIGMLMGVPKRLQHLHQYGPPFMGVSLSYAMRFGVLLLSVCLIPIFAENPKWSVWIIWAIFQVASFLALWMQIDLQNKLRARGLLEEPKQE